MASSPSDPAPVSRPGIAPASQRVAVVVNGNAKDATQEVIATLDQILMGGDLFVSRRLEDAAEIARTVVGRGYGTVLTGGGDGTFTVTVTEVIREARRQNRALPRFGLLRLGTGNAIAWVVGASKAKEGLAADIQRLLEDAGSRPIRLIEVEDFIAPFCGFGADAEVLSDYGAVKRFFQRTPLRPIAAGPLSYAVASVTRSIPSYLLRRMPHCRITNDGADAFRVGGQGALLGRPIRTGETLYEGPMRICALSTIPYYGYGLRMFPYSEEREDRMHLRVSTIGPSQFVRNFKAIWRGDYDDPDVLFDYLVESVTIEMDPATPFQIGGDARGDRGRVQAVLSSQPIRLVDFYAPPRGADPDHEAPQEG
jgi:diacylglycerol kinase family enzyme